MPTRQEFELQQASKQPMFTPKRRAPHLLQQEIINGNINVNDNKKENGSLNGGQNGSQTVVNSVLSTNYKQNSLNNNVFETVSRLYGLQKKLMFYFVDLSVLRGELNTGAVTSESLIELTGSTRKTLKKIITRLVEYGLINKEQGKVGRGGFYCFRLSKSIRNAILEYKKRLNIDNQLISDFSLQGNIITEGNGENKQYTKLPKEWDTIDCESLSDLGFSKLQLKQIYQKGTNTPEIVQQSINHFAFALENNIKEMSKYEKPLKALMGVLLKGSGWFEEKYKKPQEIALKLHLEQQRKQKKEVDTMLKELTLLEFPVWESKLKQEEIEKIVSADILKSKVKPAIKGSLRLYFTENILIPRLREEGIY
jgi:predicted transcriptional regulator